MILYKKILQEFLEPSVFILVLLIIGLIFLFKKKKKAGKILIIIGIILYYIFSITPGADLILKPLESQYQPVQENELGKTNKIVLLLGDGVLKAGEALRISRSKKQKSLWASEDGGPEAKIIISGSYPLDPENDEAKRVKKYLIERGIPPGNIILEDKSSNTFESARYVKELVGKQPFFLVTSAYHMPRSVEAFQKMGTNPKPAPTDFKIKGEYDIFDFFPSPYNLKKTDLAFHEYFGILFYKLYYY